MDKKYIALRAALAAKGSATDQIEVGIDACRSDKYRAAIQAVIDAREEIADRYCQGLGVSRLSYRWKDAYWRAEKEIAMPAVERVPGATELRTWLKKELARIDDVRKNRPKPASKHALPLRDRVCARVTRAVHLAYKQCSYNKSQSSWAGGNHSTNVVVVQRKTAGGAAGNSERVWSDNGKWSGTNSSHQITVSWGWIQTVRNRGLAVVDGMLTLSAEPCEGLRDGEEAYTARWVQQGRGVSLTCVDGYLYRVGDGFMHARSLQGARKAAVARLAAIAEEKARQEKEIATAKEEISTLHNVTIRRDEIPSFVACSSGIADWIAKRGLPPNIAEINAAQLLETAIASGDRVDFVRRIIRHCTATQKAA